MRITMDLNEDVVFELAAMSEVMDCNVEKIEITHEEWNTLRTVIQPFDVTTNNGYKDMKLHGIKLEIIR